jgi:PAS domain S-box-containing protein
VKRDGQEISPTLFARPGLLETCLSHVNDIILVTAAGPLDEPGPRIVYVNDAFTRLTGYSREEAIGRSPRFLQGPATDRRTLDLVRAQMERK